ncbi:SMI1/KNR4 family protein [Streptomyces sp. NPDC059477]|uniref:SMI1/KNR4 family protein n=1 Tax=Streptomyces sp. NPDC059477 TaxID=3346847 RepID=UPI0036D18242
MTENEQLLRLVRDKAHNDHPWGRTSLPAPVDPATVARAEATLGFRLPPLLTELYVRIGDGGFGPEYGLLPLLDSSPSEESSSVAEYLTRRGWKGDDADWLWPEAVLPISHWGCGMFACVDCLAPQAPVLLFEPNTDDAEHAWYRDAPSLDAWLRTWIDGTGWYEETNEGMDLTPWESFHTRTPERPTS